MKNLRYANKPATKQPANSANIHCFRNICVIDVSQRLRLEDEIDPLGTSRAALFNCQRKIFKAETLSEFKTFSTLV